ncbi:MAG: tryptophan synthase subunit alpha [Deltaproteobacteria bacterium]|nr:MAG: tryptophan synthase subunit alpha [Deltaproteobacteria bacterium]
MSRIADAFARAKDDRRAALVIYLSAGDPDLETTIALVLAAAEAGADIIELGVPFSDPSADGPSIQRASERALASGTTLTGVLGAVRTIRESTSVPILLFGYYNPIITYGEARLVTDAKEAGVDGFLVVDLPPEECAPLHGPALAAGLDLVPLVAPTSTPARVEAAASIASSFIYYVSLTGVTGARAVALGEAAERANALSQQVGLPVALGFGVKTPADAAEVAAHADGVVVGSAIVDAAAAADGQQAKVAAVRELVTGLAAAMAK